MSTIHEKAWGEEEWLVNDVYCGKRLTLKAQHRCSMHTHAKKDETFYIEKGLVLLETRGFGTSYVRMTTMAPGSSFRVYPGVAHRFTGIVDSVIFEFSTHHDEDDSERETVSGKVDDDEFSYIDRHVWEEIVSRGQTC